MNKRFYFIGIKGSGMSALACILKDLGLEVVGSDIEKYVFTEEHLKDHDITYDVFDANRIHQDDFVVIGNSFDESHEEVKYVLEHNIDHLRYPQFLKKLMENYASCCVVGTHGKTNTTGLLSHVLDEHEPCGHLIGDGSGYMPKNSSFFVLEACEYQRNFLNYYPDYAILLNIELDHVDYYQDMNDYLSAFQSFVDNVQKGIAVYGDQKETRQLNYGDKKVLFYGFDQVNDDVYADNIQTTTRGMEFDCYYQGNLFGHFFLPMFGKHLLCNALGVISIAIMNNVDPKVIATAFESYQGTDRRFVIEDFGQYVYIDDYAHHPTAIEACIKAAHEKYPDKKVIAIFKPDRYSRIEYFLERFDDAFKEADKTYICDFPSNAKREDGITVSIDDLIKHVSNASLLSEDMQGVEKLNQYDEAVYLFMSSKDIYKLKDQLKSVQQK